MNLSVFYFFKIMEILLIVSILISGIINLSCDYETPEEPPVFLH